MTSPQNDPYQPWPQQPSGPQHASPPPGPPRSWPARHKALTALLAVVALFVVIGAIGAAAGGGSTKTVTQPGPTVTVTQTQTVPGPTVTISVQATQNSAGQATQIQDDGVYVVGQDIPGGTWHTIGGSQCYEATLGSTDTSDILDNTNFTGPDTVNLSSAKAFQISGGCTWVRRG